MSVEKNYEEVFAFYIAESTKAVLLLFHYKSLWVPKSLITSEWDRTNLEDEQEFTIERWFLIDNEIDSWD